MPHYPEEIEYSDKYYDDLYEYRHVLLPKTIFKTMPRGRLLSENEWRALGVQQSRGWVHYEIHKPEPHILLFRVKFLFSIIFLYIIYIITTLFT